ncbi:MAG: ABC transporter ATP-binding protein [Pseudobacteriovorax sp.]|nr:ABC transporter ATP-binding protein [Pseudobacteriovorax sp.]
MEPLLHATQLEKSFKENHAVKGIDIAINPGECLALLGPNGAGKTTTVEMLEGLIEPDKGTISIFGKTLNAANRREIMTRIGVTLQENQLYKKMTVKETVQLFRSFYPAGISPDEAIAIVSLQDKANDRLEHLSGGQKQRTYLACALVNNPELVFLDEPTTGLDPQSRRKIWELLAQLKQQNKSILLTTHYMEEASFLADRIVIVDHGSVIAEGTTEDLIQKYCGGQALQFSFVDPVAVDAERLKADLPWIADSKLVDNQYELVTEDPVPLVADISAWAKTHSSPLKQIAIRPSTLEDVFLTLTGRSIRDA